MCQRVTSLVVSKFINRLLRIYILIINFWEYCTFVVCVKTLSYLMFIALMIVYLLYCGYNNGTKTVKHLVVTITI